MQIVQLSSRITFTGTFRLYLHCFPFTIRGPKTMFFKKKKNLKKKVRTMLKRFARDKQLQEVLSPEHLWAQLAGKCLHGVEPNKQEVWVPLLRFWSVFLIGQTMNGRSTLHASCPGRTLAEYSSNVRALHWSVLRRARAGGTNVRRALPWLAKWIFTEVSQERDSLSNFSFGSMLTGSKTITCQV